MHGTIAFLAAGAVLGLSAGLSPGPLLALVVSQTLAHGVGEGMKVALVPLLTDAPVILAAVFVIGGCSGSHLILGAVSIAGGLFLLRLAWLNVRARTRNGGAGRGAPRSVRKGIAVNLLSPNPYLFWLTVGAPALLNGWRERPLSAFAFAAGFYACLVGVQTAAVATAARAGRWIGGRGYRWVMRGLGALLALYGALLLKEGIGLLGALRR